MTDPFIHPYVPNTAPASRQAMLEAVGAESVDEFYADIPADLRLGRDLDLPEPLVAEQVASFELMMTLVSAGFALGLAGESQIAASREQGVVALPLAGRSPVLTTYLLQPDREPSDAVAHFIERLRGLGPAGGARTVSTDPETSQECEP